MKLDKIDLCYSLNVFPSEDNIAVRLEDIGHKFIRIRKDLGLKNDIPLALGFWSDSVFVKQMKDPDNFDLVRIFLEKNDFYVFTVNAFPFGPFHAEKVKEKVYTPDWTTELRRDFTRDAADFLVKLIPEGVTGSISTLPGGYKKALQSSGPEDYEKKITRNLISTADYLAELYFTTGKEIILGIEMEPDCLWDNPAEFIEFFKKNLYQSQNARKFIGVCYDTAHQELTDNAPGAGLDMLLENGIRIAKFQLSTALETKDSGPIAFSALQPFADQVYLHQTRLFDDSGKIIESFADIPEEKCHATAKDGKNLVSHFHLPLFCSDLPGNIAVANSELLGVLKRLKKSPEICSNLEIETYTYNVLPEVIDHRDITDCITREYKWVINQWDSI